VKEVAENTYESRPEDRRKVGRTRMRWLEDIENDARELKVKRWRQKACYAEEWTSVVNKTKFFRVL
jgi:hypothetical protein